MKHFTPLTLILLTLSTTFTNAQYTQIDMHGGKDSTLPSQHKQITNMKEMLNLDTNTTDNNTSTVKK